MQVQKMQKKGKTNSRNIKEIKRKVEEKIQAKEF